MLHLEPVGVDDGDEDIYVICGVLGDMVQLCLLDNPNDNYIEFNYIQEDVYVMDAAYVVNRVTEWK